MLGVVTLKDLNFWKGALMDTNGYFYSRKKTEYNEELRNCIEQACQCCLTDIDKPDSEKIGKPILLLGKIQSGKTRAYTGLIALAFDNGFDMVFILSKNSKALIAQTVSRMRKEFREFIDNCELEVSDIMKCSETITPYELIEKKNIIVSKKETKNMDKLIGFIKNNSIKEGKYLVIDDEADAAGIGYSNAEEGEEEGEAKYTLRAVASRVNGVRGSLNGCVFVQVTATPYALYLQPDEFDEGSGVFPIKPSSTILVPSGKDYIGGDYYFIKSKKESHLASELFERVDLEEHALISDQKNKGKKSKIEDKRHIKDEEILSDNFPLKMFKKGIINFFIGAIVLKHNRVGDCEISRCPYCGNEINLERRKTHFAHVIHTATRKNSHSRLEELARIFLDKIKEKTDADGNDVQIEKLLRDSYDDIESSILKSDYKMPPYKEVRNQFFDDLKQGRYRVDAVNSDSAVEGLLNEETGELNLKVPYSIFVGGQALDRGVTIPNMIGFYYGRNPERMQQDTVLQHSRMFGYRKKLLPVTRFYTTGRIYSNMEKMTEADIALRRDIESGAQSRGVNFVMQKSQDKKYGAGGIVLCSRNKILASNVQHLEPYKRILPVGFSPVCKSQFEKIDRRIEKILSAHTTSKEGVYLMKKSEVIEDLLPLIYQTFTEDEEYGRFVSLEEMVMYLTYFSHCPSESEFVHIVAFRNRNNAKFRKDGRLHDSPFTSQGNEDITIKQLATDFPCIALYKERGEADGWDGRPFWWPVVIAPKNVPQTVYALKTAIKRVSASR